ncbi:MAG: MoxR family ATPase [Cellulomonadaceae bacterium]|jgi:MoxR-like ATPase|nr:MoxR family ATPase [Cellulomonadaceae bacterium]
MNEVLGSVDVYDGGEGGYAAQNGGGYAAQGGGTVRELGYGGAASEEVAPLPVAKVAELGQQVLAEVGTVVVGMSDALTIALATILAGGHVLFEDVPGLGKTLAARSLAGALGLDFARLQCTPDLLPSDITGSSVFDPATRSFVFQPGPVFTDIFLADEINRTAPKTQSALLEAMAEHQVSVDGVTRKLPDPFNVIATSNPVEYEGTYPLPEAQLDRFMVRLAVGYLDPADEAVVLERRIGRRQEGSSVRPVVDAATVRAMRAGIEAVNVDPDVVRYCVDLAAATRHNQLLEVGASPRGSQNLLLLARAMAVLAGRDYVLPEDVKAIAVPVLAHRLTLTPQAWAAGVSPEKLVADTLKAVPGPATVRQAGPAPAQYTVVR